MERIEGLVHEGLALRAAFRTGYALSDSAKLVREQDEYLAALGATPGTAPGDFTEEERGDIARMIAMWKPRVREVS